MTDSLTSPAKKVRRKPKPSTKVVRDETFARATVDKTVVLPLGRDLEISCLQFGSRLSEIIDHAHSEQVKFDPTYNEVLRMRLQWPEATNMAMQILQSGVLQGQLNAKKIAESFAKLSEDQDV